MNLVCMNLTHYVIALAIVAVVLLVATGWLCSSVYTWRNKALDTHREMVQLKAKLGKTWAEQPREHGRFVKQS